MPFVKLDCGILDSTLWIDRDCREIFITALLMAEPQEFTKPLPQIEVASLNETGWQAPAGWYGFVAAAGVGIARRAGIESQAGIEALRKLGSPETESRSHEHEGRRLIRVNGGYLVLNFMKYRDKDYTSAERSRRYRERQKERHAATRVTVDATRDAVSETHINVTETRDITQAEAEAEAEAYKELRRARGARLRDDWLPNAENLEFCKAQNLDPAKTLENFRDYWLALPGAKACKLSWDRTWRKWCRTEGSKARPNGKPPLSKEVTLRIREASRDALPHLRANFAYIASVAECTQDQVRAELGNSECP